MPEGGEEDDEEASSDVWDLVELRKKAKTDKDWGLADELRDKVSALGWTIKDSKEGVTLEKVKIEEGASSEVWDLVELRKKAKADKDWGLADELRDKVSALGWTIKDSKEGVMLEKV